MLNINTWAGKFDSVQDWFHAGRTCFGVCDGNAQYLNKTSEVEVYSAPSIVDGSPIVMFPE